MMLSSLVKFPDQPLRHPVESLGISDIPRPPAMAGFQIEKAYGRFMCALMVADDSVAKDEVDPEILSSGERDLVSYSEYVRYREINGYSLVDNKDLVRFIHYVTGFPEAWILSWQLYSTIDTYENTMTDRSLFAQMLAPHIAAVRDSISAGNNRSI